LHERLQVLYHFAALDIDSLYQQLYSPAPALEIEVVPGRSLDERKRLLDLGVRRH
jgi:hypothetical protein